MSDLLASIGRMAAAAPTDAVAEMNDYSEDDDDEARARLTAA